MLELVYLGHVILTTGIRPDPEKIKAVRALPSPTNIECLQSFLGPVNHYRHFVDLFAQIASKLYHLLKKVVSFGWTLEEQSAFDKLKAD
jgi:hypothetical protein